MTARRIAAGSAGRPVRFTFDGRAYDGIEGEPLAVALLAADRVVLSRSFRFHRPRGLMCSTGQCGWCECEVDGVPSVRSCRVPVRDGLVARGEHAWPSVERDLVSLVGLFSRWIPPTFYHHRFLRPRRLRKRYLDVLRWFGGRGRLTLEGRRAGGARTSSGPTARRGCPGRRRGRIRCRRRQKGGGVRGVGHPARRRIDRRPTCRVSRCWRALRPSAGTTAWSRPSATMPRTRSRLIRSLRRADRTTGCRSSLVPTGRASWARDSWPSSSTATVSFPAAVSCSSATTGIWRRPPIDSGRPASRPCTDPSRPLRSSRSTVDAGSPVRR